MIISLLSFYKKEKKAVAPLLHAEALSGKRE